MLSQFCVFGHVVFVEYVARGDSGTPAEYEAESTVAVVVNHGWTGGACTFTVYEL